MKTDPVFTGSQSSRERQTYIYKYSIVGAELKVLIEYIQGPITLRSTILQRNKQNKPKINPQLQRTEWWLPQGEGGGVEDTEGKQGQIQCNRRKQDFAW